MKTMMTKRMSKRMCSCPATVMMRHAQSESNQHIINIYKERKKHEQASLPNSFDLRAAA